MSSPCCLVECAVCLGCSRWVWKRCRYVGADDSETWPLASPEEFEPIPRVCRAILAIYEDDLANPRVLPASAYRMNPAWVVKRAGYESTGGCAPPYLIYADHESHDILLAIRGLNLANESDYKVLLDNRLGKQMFDGGFVHHGLLKSAFWLLNQEGLLSSASSQSTPGIPSRSPATPSALVSPPSSTTGTVSGESCLRGSDATQSRRRGACHSTSRSSTQT